MCKSTLQDVAMAMAESLAKRRFRGDPDREAKVADAQSVAWEMAQDVPEAATAGTIAFHAVQWVAGNRQFRESIRSIDCPPKPWMARSAASRGNFRRVHADPRQFYRLGDNPAEIVALQMDMRAWLERLPERTVRIVSTLAAGHRTQDAALMFRLSQGRISQIRDELRESWEAFQS